MKTGTIPWRSPPVRLALLEKEVHIWRDWLEPSDEGLQSYLQTLSEQEIARAGRFHFERDRQHYIQGRGKLRALLSRYLGIEAGEVCLETNQHGKPQLGREQTGSHLQFNLAHSADGIVFGFCRGLAVGVDIEHIHEIADMDAVAGRFFSQQEQAEYRQLPSSQRLTGFFTCWTCKEAFIKNIGDGLYHPLDQFDVSLQPDQPARLLRVASDLQEASCWSLVSFPVWDGYLAALAVRGTDLKIRYLSVLS
jgi:4'-phosphopantetheinyl transferase